MGGSIESALPDHSTITGSIAPDTTGPQPDSSTASDQSTIRNVISALNFTQWGKQPIPWANPDTGSQGAITAVAETTTNNQLCRKFQTSREAFDGVALYKGEACMQPGGKWVLTSFAPL